MARKKKTTTIWEFDHVCPHCRKHYDQVAGENIPGVALLRPGSPAEAVVAELGTEDIVFEQLCHDCKKESGGRYAVRIKAWYRLPNLGGGYVLSIAKPERRY